MLTIISYNVMFNEPYLEQRHKALISLIYKNEADIVCLQEVRAELVEWFITILSKMYISAMTSLQPASRAYGELIFVRKTDNKFTIKDTFCIPLPGKMDRALQHVEIEHKGVVYNILTFHFESLNCKKIRCQQLETMWEYVCDLDNVICCGDTNQTVGEVCKIPERFYDAWEHTDGNIGEYTYFSGRFWDGDRKQRYDKMWFSNDIQLAGFGILGNKPITDNVWISDHDGLLAICQ